MERSVSDSNQYRELVEIVAQVRRRWRLKLAMRGVAALLALLLVTFLISAFALGETRFAPAAIITARVILAVVFLGAVALLIVPPLWRRVTDEQVALYLEEREPSLKSSLIGALAVGRTDGISPALARKTIEMAVARCRKVESGRNLERKDLNRSTGLVVGVLAAALVLAFVSPTYVRQSARALFLPLRTTAAQAADLMRVEVAPGDTTIARGADLPVSADLVGFGGRNAFVNARFEGSDSFERIPMVPREGAAGFDLRLFNLRGPVQYYVEAEGIESPVYRVEVLDLPYVDRLRVELVYPAYTGLEPQIFEDGGDIYAPVGTTVRLTASPTIPVTAGELDLGDGVTIPLTLGAEGTLSAEFEVTKSSLYHIELESANAPRRAASPEYLIEVMDDAAPIVRFSTPGRDIRVTLVDEPWVEAEASDDFGVRNLELVYSVNGEEEKVVSLYTAEPLREVSAGHTFYLEDLGLQAGDFVSYYARVTDVGPNRKPVTSDMYFLEVRPFGVEYRQADAQQGGGGGGGGGGQQGDDDQLSRRQRELISATFNVIRDRDDYTPVELEQNLEALSTAQEALRRQALTLAERLSNRGAVRDTSFDIIADALPKAAEEMAYAVQLLLRQVPDEALPHEQRALVQLQRAESAFREVQVSLGSQGGGGGQSSSGGFGPSAEDLADLFGLELDQLRNQYETLQRSQAEQAATEVDQAADKIRELARRLEQQNEQLRQQMSLQSQSGGSGDAQRQMAEEAMEEARRLERLSREQQRQDLADAAQQLRDAAESLRRAAADQRSGNAGNQQQALDRLRDATRRLERGQAENLQTEAENIARQAERLSDEQRGITEDLQNLPQTGAGRAAQAADIVDRKEDQIRELEQMQETLERLAGEARSDQPDAARRLRSASDAISRTGLPDEIRSSRANTAPNMPVEYGRRAERSIQERLDELERLTREASNAITQPNNTGDRSLDQARDLVRGLESMQQRLQQGQGRGQQGQQSQGQEGQQGQDGQQGQGQQQGQEGQQGQGQQGQGQQGQGQQGQGQEGQQGQGQQSGGQQGGRGGADGAFGNAGGYVDGAYGDLGYGGRWNDNPEAVRQMRNELRQRINEASELRDQLRADGMDTAPLDEVIRDLRGLDSDQVFEDSGRLPLLQEAVLDKLKQFEFNLYQALRGEEARRLFFSGNGDVPPEYRELVERYYREMADVR